MHDTLSFAPQMRYGSNSGQPMSRRDGTLKVTGAATFAADNSPDNLLYAVPAVSTIARGRVTHLDVDAARAHPGVVEVITPANRPALMKDPDSKTMMFDFRIDALQKAGLCFSGMSPDGELPEILERSDHPWFVGVQFHPELKSKPFEPHPLFTSFIKAAVEQARLV